MPAGISGLCSSFAKKIGLDISIYKQLIHIFIKSEFTVITKAYLLPEDTNSIVTNKVSNLRKVLSPSKVVFGYETDASDSEINKK